jgi:glutamate synthase domain-containing protein 3
MAGPADVVERSMTINAKFLPRLEAAVEQNALLRIGWTGSGEEVPKNGEVGLCPAMPKGARIRALGKLGSWTSSFGLGGKFDIEGEAGSFFGAYNNGGKISATGFIGRCAGFMMQNGELIASDGAGDDLGMFMNDGLIYVRGDVGQRIGNGMTGGTIIVQGDVGKDAGCEMKGGRIIIEGRCPTPPQGIQLRPLTAKELTELNKILDAIKEHHLATTHFALNPTTTSSTTSIVQAFHQEIYPVSPSPQWTRHLSLKIMKLILLL